MQDQLTAGQFAKIAATTKRTIHFYDQKGILKPKIIGENNYRYYSPEQILDYQMILLLTTMHVTLNEIKNHLDENGSIQQLFEEKKVLIQNELESLKFNLNNVNSFIENMEKNGTMIDPRIINMQPFEIYYIERVGAYAQIESFCNELRNMFDKVGSNFTTLSIFAEHDYRPHKSHIKISCLVNPDMKVKKQYEVEIKKMMFDPGKVLTYTHNGAGELLSFFWKELEEYARLNDLTIRQDIPDFEIYRKVNSDIKKQFFEIYLPIE